MWGIIGVMRKTAILGASIVIVGCATADYTTKTEEDGSAQEAFDFEEEAPPEIDFEPAVIGPRTSKLGDGVSYISQFQSPQRQALTNDDVRTQISGWGRSYAQLRIELRDNIFTLGGDRNSIGTSIGTATCAGDSLSGLGKLLGGIIKLKKNYGYTLTVSISEQNGSKYFVKNFPVVTFSRLNDKKCTYQFNEETLTPRIAVRSNDRLKFEVSLHRTKSREININQVFNDVATIAGFFTQTPTDGVVSGAIELAASPINTRINEIMSEWDKDTKVEFTTEIPLGLEPALKNDTVVISDGLPTNYDSNELISFRGLTSIWFHIDRFPTLFAECDHFGISSCDAYETPTMVLGQKYYELNRSDRLSLIGLSLNELANKDRGVDGNAPSFKRRLLEIKQNEMNDKAAKQRLSEVCTDMLNSPGFKPYQVLNKIDTLIFRYSLLATTTDYLTNYAVNTPDCFSEDQRSRLRDLSTPPGKFFKFAEYEAPISVLVAEAAGALSRQLRDGLDAKKALFGERGKADIRLEALLFDADGAELRPSVRTGEAAAAMIADIKFEGGPACFHEGVDTTTGQVTDKKFGFLHRIRDQIPGGYYDQYKDTESRGRLYVPFVVQFDDTGELASMTLPESWREYHRTLLGRKLSEDFDPWAEPCHADLSNPAALEALKAIMN